MAACSPVAVLRDGRAKKRGLLRTRLIDGLNFGNATLVPSRHLFHLRLTLAPEPAKSLRKTSPPFITNFTRSSSVTSFAGLPETATKSAYLPFSMDPTRSPQPMFSAATEVAER